MPYTKPYTYTTGATLTAQNQNSNDEAAKKYVNQGIVVGDFATETLDTEDIARGEFEPITKSHSFVTGHHHGGHKTPRAQDRAYFTSHIKPSLQVSNTYFAYQPLYETGTEINLEYDADVIIDFGAPFISELNVVQTNEWWDSLQFLEIEDLSSNTVTRYGVTRAYSFEEIPLSSSIPASGGSVDPFGGLPPSSVLGNEPDGKYAVRRWIGWRKGLSLTAGRYLIRSVINAKVEEGYTSSRNFTIEILYKSN